MQRCGARSYRFEAAWVEEEECKEVVKKAWREAKEEGPNPVAENLKRVSKELWQWKGGNFLSMLERKVKLLKKELEMCRRRRLNQEDISREGVLRYKLDKAQE